MFQATYLFVLAVAALPLALILLQGDRSNRIAFVHRLYRDRAYILAAIPISRQPMLPFRPRVSPKPAMLRPSRSRLLSEST
jgi:hypothetical protein